MTRGDNGSRGLLVFILRNLILYFLLVNTFLQLRELLDIGFQSAAFLVAVLAALWMEKGKLRFLPALLAACALPFLVRAVFFLVFRLERGLAPGQATDFLSMLFDKDFVPALIAYAVGWLFNFLALRKPGFAFLEVGLNSLLLLLVFWAQAGYKLKLYPHPWILAALLAGFVVSELFVLLLSWMKENRAGRLQARALWSFSWIVLPLLLVFLFFLLGKYSEGAVRAGGGLMKPTLFRFDFSPFVRLESEIRTSDETVLLFRTEGKAERWLLRRFVLSGYEQNRGFFMEKGSGIDEYPTTVPDSPVEFPDPGYKGRKDAAQEYFFLSIDPSSLIALNYPRRVIPLRNWKSSSFLRVYRVISRAFEPAGSDGSFPARAEPPTLPARTLAYYTRYGGDEQIRNLALSITANEPTYSGKVNAITRYLKLNYLYSLRPGIAADGDQLHYFLFNAKKGYCSYFAFAMALMCRSLGIPARVAVGFYVDPRMEVLNFYEVHAFQAHAWVEVYFGDKGWIEFDPTSDKLAPGEDFSFFMGPDKERMARLIREILANQDSLEAEQAPAPPPGAAGSLGGGIARTFWLLARVWYITLPALYLLYLLAAKLLPSVPSLLSRDRRRRARGLYRLSLVPLAGSGLAKRVAESHAEYAGRVAAENGIALGPVTDGYLKAVFGDVFEECDLQAFASARKRLAASYRKHVPAVVRAAGFLNPLHVLHLVPRSGRGVPTFPGAAGARTPR